MAPLVVLHEQTGQPSSCMEGLARYANRVASSSMTGQFPDEAQLRDWLWVQPVKLDLGEDGTIEQGCNPAQRSRLWPKDGMNCWESSAHWLGWNLRNRTPIEAHLYDVRIGGQRHVFPATRALDSAEVPRPVVLQPPYDKSVGRSPLQALVYRTAQALGPLPQPLQLIRRKEYFPWDNVGDFVVEMGGMQTAEHTGLLPESVLSSLPPFWRQLKVRQWPTANGDLLFLILEKDWVPSFKDVAIGFATGGFSAGVSEGGGHGHANVILVRGGALASKPVPLSTLPDGAPPANSFCNCIPGAPAQAWGNDLLGGVHWVGDTVLRAFGLGKVSDQLSTIEGDALPDWSRTDEQRKAREIDAEKKRQEEADRAAAQQEHEHQQAELARQRVELQRKFDEDNKQAELALANIRETQRKRREALDSLGADQTG